MTEHTNTAARSRVVREKVIRFVWLLTALLSAAAVVFILGYLIYTALPAFTEVGISGFFFNADWNPTGSVPSYGVAALIIDTLLVTLGALIFAVPLGLATAVYLSYLAPPRIRDMVKPIIELLAGIPSVVYGFFGMVVLCSFLRTTLDIPSGFSWLAASVILGIMALPTIVSVSEDALFAVPKDYKEASLGLGATYWHTISRVLLPAAASGISAAVVLGMGRAIGETMAVMMVAGNAAIIPEPIWNVLSPVRTLTATLGIEMAEVATGSMHYYALFGVAVILLVIALVVNLASAWIMKRTQAGRGSAPRLSAGCRKRLKLFSAAILCVVFFCFLAAALGLLWAVVAAALACVWYFGRAKVSHKIAELGSFGVIYACTAAVILILAVILWDIFSNGLPVISWEFLTEGPRDLGRDGGIYPAIIGTLQLVGGAILAALPIGIGAAIYFIEYARENFLTRALRIGNDLLNGTPSIVFGLFGFAFFVIYLNWGICMLAGQICLALMILPTIIRTTEEALKSVPGSLREASLGLGATKWQTIKKVVLPSAAPGILTGAILSIGRAAGETAPIMFTAVVFTKRFVTMDVFDPVMALPFHLYVLSTSVPGATAQQYGTAVVLIVLVMAIYLAAVLLRRHFQQKLLR
ncbi:phosphate ABC transporter permease PstA [Methanocorpusculum vombati]|uniref:Phosphate ABC transporter permease PstA n=1 Tax=Methanocorpusculum vombati TaxID=3002864 RepID=A0ABT4IL37_9EURY|nr:phosphate ABC transporter permease PstA [Methanocorpusculum vombati]MCZ9319080.1 phosphate ABC transporter permease PstA [Methanocorpusculum sp.]MCZ0862475.1 phosphate ABC transporter permease PstA [Methanocorpusculum vombati]MDE2520714.1 phosphate ABC transporter permease PstA [Methanocorpusculum sp.]MDE2534852.1 phosphate ABC transporter permease PstA [Methanocorpusculum sp.]MDE2547679.1 phosphate ABC transporter permease PstA [Methanocorpusculum sp.]